MEGQIISWKVQKYRRCQEKDLGVVLDDKLRFSRHIAAAAACVNRKLGLLKHTFKYWTEESCIQACTPTLKRDRDLGEGTEEGNQISAFLEEFAL